jgi:hypothetical protein
VDVDAHWTEFGIDAIVSYMANLTLATQWLPLSVSPIHAAMPNLQVMHVSHELYILHYLFFSIHALLHVCHKLYFYIFFYHGWYMC